jgi:hypothetical protein
VAEPSTKNVFHFASTNDVGVRHVTKQSVMDMHQDYCVVGRYDNPADTFMPVGATTTIGHVTAQLQPHVQVQVFLQLTKETEHALGLGK